MKDMPLKKDEFTFNVNNQIMDEDDEEEGEDDDFENKF